MTNEVFNRRLATIMNAAWNLSKQSGRKVDIAIHLPEEDYPDEYAVVQVDNGRIIAVYPDGSDSWHDTPSVHRSTFNYDDACVVHQELMDWAESLGRNDA